MKMLRNDNLKYIVEVSVDDLEALEFWRVVFLLYMRQARNYIR